MSTAFETVTMQPKWFLKSKTVWGAIVATAPIWLKAVGVDIGEDNLGLLSKYGNDILGVIGTGLVLYGRFKANTGAPVKMLPK